MNHPSLKRPIMYATRDFPDHCGPQAKKPASSSRTRDFPDHCGSQAKKPASSGRTNEVVFPKAEHETSDIYKSKVKNTLKLFQEIYKKVGDEEKAKRLGKNVGAKRMDIIAAEQLKKRGGYINSEKRFGHIPGISIGDRFRLRAELNVIGLHMQYTSGIDYMFYEGMNISTSIVNSGCYGNKAQTVDVLIYSGQGGHKGFGNEIEHVDQELKRGNLALKNSVTSGYPVRVINKCQDTKDGISYVYDGLYLVKRFWEEKEHGKTVFKFELHRVSGQEKCYVKDSVVSVKPKSECCVMGDVSQGKENLEIKVMNGVDSQKPETFVYITEVMYPQWCKKVHLGGCDCVDGCSSSALCRCGLKNGGEILFSQQRILKDSPNIPRSVVYECGPSCKCPPSCANRVSQQGPRIKFEVFRIGSKGWGVRSPNFISKGSFVCEFIGKLMQIEDEVDRQQERFSGFTVDAKKFGNIGRFIRYSDSPNLFVQRVLYDHEDERMPHIMMFAAESIPPKRELTCGYDHQVVQIGRLQFRL